MVNNLIVCGGTFDHFHAGHKEFIRYASSLGRKLFIGITSDVYVLNSKFPQKSGLIESFEKRKQSVIDFIKSEGTSDKAKVVKIDDLFGYTLSKDLLIDGIVVSEDTKSGADIINSRRKDFDLSPLRIFIAPFIKAEDGRVISSQRIRNGEINREGKLYIEPLWLKKDLVLPEDLRNELAKPFGLLNFDILKDKNKSKVIISVGDATTEKFNKLGIDQQLSVIDFKIAREEEFYLFSDLGFSGKEKIVIAKNPPGQITHESFNKIQEIFRLGFDNRVVLKIVGEEDLIVLPLVLAAPLDAIIYYGQPNVGLVRVLVSEGNKDGARNLLSKFKPI
jgi:pantetheine-phosphate adenylyltransferase